LDDVEEDVAGPRGTGSNASEAESQTASRAGSPTENRTASPVAESEVGSAAGSDGGSETSKKKSASKRVKESLEQMMSRAKSFVKVGHSPSVKHSASLLRLPQIGKLRTKAETTAQLRTYFDEASTVNTKTKVKNMRTSSGIKDTFQLVFLEKLFESYKGKRGKARQEALDAKARSLPKVTTSPVWRIKGSQH
jgi:hypothetical protein